ncbi:MAG: serine hydrolase domain-containing protein [Bacteroidota bacterium]
MDIKDLIQQARKKFRIPAIVVLIVKGDEVLVQEIQGTRVVDTDNPATLEDYFHIGSCSKSVLAVMAGKLVESTHISWASKFFDVYPELLALANPAYRDICLEDLFLCQAGIQPYTDGKEAFPDMDEQAPNQRLEFAKQLVQQKPSARKQKDGSFKHLYSNASYTMAALMLEKVSGKPYEELLQQTLTTELGLDVFVGWPNQINENQPWGHLIRWRNITLYPPDDPYRLPYLLTPSGDLSMKPIDYARYTQLHLKGLQGNSSFLKQETLQHIHFGHKGFSMGVGNFNGNMSAMDGSAGTFFCRSIFAPDSDMSVSLMMNAGSGKGRMKAIDWLTKKVFLRK